MNPNRFLALALFAWLAAAPAGEARAQWVPTYPLPVGNSGRTVVSLAVSGTNLFAATENDGVYLSTNNGTSWTGVNTGLFYQVNALAVSGTNLFAGTEGGVFLSTNNGTSWTAVNTGFSGIDLSVCSLAVSGANLFSGTYAYGVYLSTNNGANWTAANTGMLITPRVYALAVSGTNLFAGIDGGGVYLSTNNGTSWTADTIGLTYADIYSLCVSGDNLFAGNYAGNSGAGVFLSTNNGATWDSAASGLPSGGIVTSLAASDTNLFAGIEAGSVVGGVGVGSGVYLSTNNGTTWMSSNTGLPASTDVFCFAIIGEYLFAGTDGGSGTVWRRPLSDFGISSVVETQVAAQPNIHSYPNPFSQSTQITFTSQAAGYADVSVVNILGAPVTHLFSGELDAGEHDFAWSGSGMSGHPVAPGSYWCVVRMGGSVERIALSVER